jgi:hypothetical protein
MLTELMKLLDARAAAWSRFEEANRSKEGLFQLQASTRQFEAIERLADAAFADRDRAIEQLRTLLAKPEALDQLHAHLKATLNTQEDHEV